MKTNSLAGVQATVMLALVSVFFWLQHRICHVTNLYLGFLSQFLSAKFRTFRRKLHTWLQGPKMSDFFHISDLLQRRLSVS